MINRTYITEKEFNDIKDKLNSLISANNTLERIIEVFNTDPIIKEYLEKAEEDAYDCNCQSLPAIMCETLREMAYDIKDFREREEITDTDEYIRKLQVENAHLRAKYNKLKEITNKVYGLTKDVESE